MDVEGSQDLRVLVVGPDWLGRAGMVALVDAELDVVDSLPDDADAAEMVGRHRVDVVVWDLGSEPPRPGRWDELGVPVLALVEDLAAARAALRDGAQGVLLRRRASVLVPWLRALAAGAWLVDESFAPEVLRRRSVTGLEPLTRREQDVLEQLAEGLSNRKIGRVLGVSEHTIKFHVNALLGKLEARSRTEAVVRAARAGLLDL